MGELYGLEMTGRSVLDVGGYDGRAALQALGAGAMRATVIDNGEWRAYEWSPPGELDQRIEYIAGNFLSVRKPADIVFCFLVLYHLKAPTAGLIRLRELAREALVISSSFVTEEEAGPNGWKRYPNGSGHSNGTVWARPTKAALENRLHVVGFHDVHEYQAGGANDEVTFVAR